MYKFSLNPVKGKIILNIKEIKNGECVIDIISRIPDREDRIDKTYILEEGDEFGLFEVVGVNLENIHD